MKPNSEDKPGFGFGFWETPKISRAAFRALLTSKLTPLLKPGTHTEARSPPVRVIKYRSQRNFAMARRANSLYHGIYILQILAFPRDAASWRYLEETPCPQATR